MRPRGQPAAAPSDVDAALAAVPDGAHLHLSGYSLLDRPSRPAGLARAARRRAERGLTTSVDAASAAPLRRVGGRPSWTGCAARTCCWPTSTRRRRCSTTSRLWPDDLARRAGHRRPQFVVVKLGPDGAVWAGPTARCSAPTPSRAAGGRPDRGRRRVRRRPARGLAARRRPSDACGPRPPRRRSGWVLQAAGRIVARAAGQLPVDDALVAGGGQRGLRRRDRSRAAAARPPAGRAIVGQDHREPRQHDHADDAQASHRPHSGGLAATSNAPAMRQQRADEHHRHVADLAPAQLPLRILRRVGDQDGRPAVACHEITPLPRSLTSILPPQAARPSRTQC